MEVKRIDSSDENVSKYVYDFGSAVAEAVLYKYPTYEQRTVICCSTQSGCPVGCRFCGAGDAFVRSLRWDEIVDQVDYLLKDRNIDMEKVERCQIMFMSMGEPLLNLDQLTFAIDVLHRKYPNAALLISTSAPKVDYEKVRVLSQRVDKVGLQFSVHESTDEARNALVPFKAKLDLSEIAAERRQKLAGGPRAATGGDSWPLNFRRKRLRGFRCRWTAAATYSSLSLPMVATLARASPSREWSTRGS